MKKIRALFEWARFFHSSRFCPFFVSNKQHLDSSVMYTKVVLLEDVVHTVAYILIPVTRSVSGVCKCITTDLWHFSWKKETNKNKTTKTDVCFNIFQQIVVNLGWVMQQWFVNRVMLAHFVLKYESLCVTQLYRTSLESCEYKARTKRVKSSWRWAT